MKFIRTTILLCILAFSFAPINTFASSLGHLPSIEKSNQWEVVINKPKSDELKSKPNVYNVYSMGIKYIGNDDIEIERVEVYRDDPSSPSDFELFTEDFEIEKDKTVEPSFQHQNFPISTQAKQLKVIITWTKKEDGRRLRKEFVFKQ